MRARPLVTVLSVLTLAACTTAPRAAVAPAPGRLAATPVPVRAEASPALRVVISASRPFHLCAQQEVGRARCVARGPDRALERLELEIDGWIARVEPWVRFVDGARIVDAVPQDGVRPRSDALPFAATEVAPLTRGVACVRGEDGRVACDSDEGAGDFRPVLLAGSPIAAVSIVGSWDTLLALDAAGRLLCVGRTCDLLAAQRQALAAGEARPANLPAMDTSLASGTGWPVSAALPAAVVVAEDVARVRTDGLGAACIEDRRHRVACHGGRYDPVVTADVSGALDFAFAAHALCVLTGPAATARLECRYFDHEGAVTTVLAAEVPGALRLHAGGTTLCVERSGGLACTELRGSSPAEPLVEVLAPGA
jgi:hypothetical protein